MARGKGTYGDEGFDQGGPRSNGKEMGFDRGGSRGKKTAPFGFDGAGMKASRSSKKGKPSVQKKSSI